LERIVTETAGLCQGEWVISVSLDPNGLHVRLTGTERFLAWPEPNEVLVPSGVIASAVSHPDFSSVPDMKQISWSLGRGIRTLPVVPGHWVFGRRRNKTGRFYFALRGAATPVLVVETHDWELDGVVVSTPQAAALATSLEPTTR